MKLIKNIDVSSIWEEINLGIYITGDIHGNPFSRFSTNAFYEQKEFSKNKDENIIIELGDFGIIWNGNGENAEEKYKLDWLAKKNFTVAFIDGNHDNIPQLDTYPIKEWNGGLVNEIRPNVLRLRRGEIFTIEGKKFFVMGGASSHDIQDGILDPDSFDDYDEFRQVWKQWDKEWKMFRVKGLSWWAEELPSAEEMQNGINNLEKHNWKVDYILSHTPPASVIALLGHGLYEQDKLTKYLEDIRSKTEFKRHWMGHMHVNRQVNDKDILLYEQIIRIA